jgi:hypothetical protein
VTKDLKREREMLSIQLPPFERNFFSFFQKTNEKMTTKNSSSLVLCEKQK